MIALAYGCGLRVSEVINLKIKDIDLDELTIHIKVVKGNENRIIIFFEKLKNDIINLIFGRQRNNNLFESERGRNLIEWMVQKIFGNALQIEGGNTKGRHFLLVVAQFCYLFIRKWREYEIYAQAFGAR